jgi:hypothetical protein
MREDQEDKKDKEEKKEKVISEPGAKAEISKKESGKKSWGNKIFRRKSM